MRLYVADRETGTFIEEVETIEEGKQIIESYEQEDKEEGNYTPDFYDIVDEDHISQTDSDIEKHLKDEEVRELALNLDWGDPRKDPEDIMDSLRTNWEVPLSEESVEAVYKEMCRIWDDKNAE